MLITQETVAKRIAAYIQHQITLDDLAQWADHANLASEYEHGHEDVIASVIARLSPADVQAFGLTWEDCEHLLARLGYKTQVEIVRA